MVQLKCPVCEQEYTQHDTEYCLKCFWLLTSYSQDLEEQAELIQREQKRLELAKKAYNKYLELAKNCSKIKQEYMLVQQELALAKKHNQQQLNYLSLEKYLPEISSNIQHLSSILSIVQQINDKLSIQNTEQNPALHQLNSQEDIALDIDKNYEFGVTETDSSLLINEEIGSFNDTQEATILAQDYNQQADFNDKIEVSETEYSKSQRWNGSQAAAIFERNTRGRGEYWIIDNKYLVPKPKQKINKNSYETLAVLFKIHNHEQNLTDNIMLLKPAQVCLINDEDKWHLEETGIIKFC